MGDGKENWGTPPAPRQGGFPALSFCHSGEACPREGGEQHSICMADGAERYPLPRILVSTPFDPPIMGNEEKGNLVDTLKHPAASCCTSLVAHPSLGKEEY